MVLALLGAACAALACRSEDIQVSVSSTPAYSPTRQPSATAAPLTTPASATHPQDQTPDPTDDTSSWFGCLGIVKEEGDRLLKVGERFCIVQGLTGTLVSTWPDNLDDAADVARAASAYVPEPCAQNTAYFFANLPDLGFPKIQVKDYVCN